MLELWVAVCKSRGRVLNEVLDVVAMRQQGYLARSSSRKVLLTDEMCDCFLSNSNSFCKFEGTVHRPGFYL